MYLDEPHSDEAIQSIVHFSFRASLKKSSLWGIRADTGCAKEESDLKVCAAAGGADGGGGWWRAVGAGANAALEVW